MLELWPVIFVILWGTAVALMPTGVLAVVPAVASCFALGQITKNGKSPWR